MDIVVCVTKKYPNPLMRTYDKRRQWGPWFGNNQQFENMLEKPGPIIKEGNIVHGSGKSPPLENVYKTNGSCCQKVSINKIGTAMGSTFAGVTGFQVLVCLGSAFQVDLHFGFIRTGTIMTNQ